MMVTNRPVAWSLAPIGAAPAAPAAPQTDARLSSGPGDPRWRDPAVVARRIDPNDPGSRIYFDSRGSTAAPPRAPRVTNRVVGGR